MSEEAKQPKKVSIPKAKPKAAVKKVKKQKTVLPKGKIAIIRIRGVSGVRHDIRKTLTMFRLFRKHNCVVVENSPSTSGRIIKIKDYVTFGEIDDKTYQLLVDKRGRDFKGREQSRKGKVKYDTHFIKIGGRKIKPYFRLSPPRGGFERKGIKVSFKNGGVLGYRGDKMAQLIKKMI